MHIGPQAQRSSAQLTGIAGGGLTALLPSFHAPQWSMAQVASGARVRSVPSSVCGKSAESSWRRLSGAAAASSLCTIKSTGTQPQYQHYFLCRTCADKEAPLGLGVCVTCRSADDHPPAAW